MPRQVEVRHRDSRGTILYTIFEKPEDVSGQVRNIWDAEEGDFVQANNGWIPPLLRKRILTSTTALTATGKRIQRHTPIIFWEFIFPKMKWICRPEQARTKSFNYKPVTSALAASEEKRNRASELTLKRLLFCQYILEGMDPRMAALCVWPDSRNPTRIAKVLLLQPKIIHYLTTQIQMRKNMNQMLDEQGMTDEAVIGELITMARGDDTRRKIWALDKILEIKAEKKPSTPESDQLPPPPSQEEDEKLQIQQQMRDKYGDKYLGEAKPIS